MGKPILIAMAAGLVVGLVVGVLLKTVPVIDGLIPDNLNSLITGGIAGGAAVLAIGRGKKPDV